VRALRLFEAESGPVHPDVANVVLELSAIAEDLGDYATSERHARRAHAILQRFALRGDPALVEVLARLRARALNQLGAIAVARGDYREARAAHARALAIATKHLPAIERVVAMNGLAVACKYTARWAEAARLYRGALRLVERSSRGADRDAALATLFHNLGGLELARGRARRAEPFARRAVTLRERAMGARHPATALDVAALAAVVDAAGRHAEAERLYRRAIAVFEATFGKAHVEVAFNLAQLAVLYQTTGRLREAERLYRRALPRLERALGKRHPTVALTLANLAALRRSQGKTADAGALHRRALRIYRATLGDRHPDVIAAQSAAR